MESTPKINWSLVWAIGAFVLGNLSHAAANWGKSTASMESLAIQVSKMEGAVNTLTDTYIKGDKANGKELQQIEDHLTYDDKRLDAIEKKYEK